MQTLIPCLRPGFQILCLLLWASGYTSELPNEENPHYKPGSENYPLFYNTRCFSDPAESVGIDQYFFWVYLMSFPSIICRMRSLMPANSSLCVTIRKVCFIFSLNSKKR